jgi:hypothetical protein
VVEEARRVGSGLRPSLGDRVHACQRVAALVEGGSDDAQVPGRPRVGERLLGPVVGVESPLVLHQEFAVVGMVARFEGQLGDGFAEGGDLRVHLRDFSVTG